MAVTRLIGDRSPGVLDSEEPIFAVCVVATSVKALETNDVNVFTGAGISSVMFVRRKQGREGKRKAMDSEIGSGMDQLG